MPTYEYACDSCGHSFERLQSINAEPLKRCPKCRRKVRRVIHGGAGLLFRGSGFYCTDNRSSSSGGDKSPSADAGCGKDSACAKSASDADS